MNLLELGGGTKPHPLADVVLDIRHPKGAPKQDLTAGRWCTTKGEIRGGSVDAIYASHVLEHIAKGAATLHVMDEAWRVLKPGGTFTAKVPVIAWAGCKQLVTDWRVYADPTHVQFWYLPQSLFYFTGEAGESAEYGAHTWQPVGPRFDPQSAYETCDAVGTTGHLQQSWWAVGDGGQGGELWEGMWTLVKP